MSRWRWWLAFLMVVGPVAGAAQQAAPALPEYTDQQRWNRLGFVDAAWMATAIELGKAKGMTPEQIGEWIGEYFSTGWVGGSDPRRFLGDLRLNHLSHPAGRVEVTTLSDTLVVARFNTPQLGAFGGDRYFYGVTLDELKTINLRSYQVLAGFVGVRLDARYDGDWLVMTLRHGYQVPKASPQMRWERAAFLSKIMVIELIRIAKARGMTPEQAGADGVKNWLPGWAGSDTPYRLLRGILWNGMTDHNLSCEMLEASPTVARARCNRPYVGTVRDQQATSGVTVEEYEAFWLAQEQGLANGLGMSWEARIEGNNRLITVRRR